jgi:hypothetical protein
MTSSDIGPATEPDSREDGHRLTLSPGQRAGIWIAATIVAVVPLAILTEITPPATHPALDEVINALMAGALPGIYFGLSAGSRPSLTKRRAILPMMLSKFSATVMVSLALGALAVGGGVGA